MNGKAGKKETLQEFIVGVVVMGILLAIAVTVFLGLLDRAIAISARQQAAADGEAIALARQILDK